ncbi:MULTISPECIES: alpha/beta hydrolase [unclassified Pseudomonas]|uniref:alpha/beta fold hydrolase n=1 Tax=unclassified Pseudomonas TaxID=196821 RepID=UPI002AC9A55D|nr:MULTISPECIES: alpha/beta hydrolase [unclassified Pseudomonas]MEB0043561.1 alpha/beta hydrolase [Pseudomonas sp. MH10]MEB0123730.1 alpha/beta hydrolase [Pseudomonas sp. CCI1.2]WPX65928.1 alpha/beta hydrolase [Pseudomonas sp. MH10]
MSKWFVVVMMSVSLPLFAAEAPSYGPQLEGFDYPYAAKNYAFESQGQRIQMGYMDIKPSAKPNGRTVVLLHGKNFCGATWEGTIKPLSEAGYRVVVPDQIGFCRSSKPEDYTYSFKQLAQNTRGLLNSLGIDHATIVGHSMGGMLATRFALTYPKQVDQLVLVDPLGLEDWKAKGVPAITFEQWYARDLKTTAQTIRKYQQATYYANQWRPEFDRWVTMQAGMYTGSGRDEVARASAMTYVMIFNQPVFYEFEKLQMPTLLLIGQKDNTAIGKDLAPEPLRSTLGNYPDLGKAVAKRIPHATLVEFAELGHSPQIQDPALFNKALLDGLMPSL